MRVQRTPICGVKGSFNKILGSVVLKRFTLKALITTTADSTLKHFGLFFSEKILDISCELSARQTIHMKCHVLFSLKNKINF